MVCVRSFLACAAVGLLTPLMAAQEPIHFARTPDISPDGRQVAFSYLGDIWVVETIGGMARPVTMHEAHDLMPLYSPDGRSLAFTSNRHGSYDVYVTSVQGGKPRRLTADSASDIVSGWSPDGKHILFSSTRSQAFPVGFELYTVPVEGGNARRISANEGKEGVFSPKGDQIAYVRGPGSWYRKGYRGSSNDDIWICNADGSNNRQLTTFAGQDTSPMWSPDGQFLYYVSEVFGTPANIVRQDSAGKSKPVQLTFHKDDSVRRARISGNGQWIVYECGADIWVVSAHEGQAPRKLSIEIHADDKSNTERTVTMTRGATEFALSADEQHLVFAVHGDLFLMPASGGKTTRLTNDPAYDHSAAWAPDGKKMVFASDRNGHEDLYLLESDDAAHAELAKAHKFKVKQITDTPEAEIGPSFSPDGKQLAFLRAGQLWLANSDGTMPRLLVKEVQVFDYEWSPDGKWMAYARSDGSFASEVYIVPLAGGEARNVTRYATYNADITWSHTGNKLAFVSQRRDGTSLYVLTLQKPAATGAPASSEFDWEDIHLRAKRPAAIPAEEGAISYDGSKVAFRSSGSSGDDLWVAASGGGQMSRMTTGNARPQQIRWSKKQTDVLFFRDGSGALRRGTAFGGDPAVIPFNVKMVIRRDEEYAEMFEQSWRALREYFYDATFHGSDWYAVRAKFRPLVKHVAQREDLYTLITLMLGELNASHLGISGPGAIPEAYTADLGLLFDEKFPGPGLKVAEILKRGPADKRGLNLKPGDIITAIDGTPLTERTEISSLLNDKANETVTLKVTSLPTADPRDPKAFRDVEVQAVGRDQISGLMYERWVANNARRVTELSKGTLGYIHIPSMDEAGLDRFVRALYSDNFDKDAIVLDVRYNGGGFTHDQVLNYLGAKEHTFFRNRFGGEGMVLRSHDRKWTKPVTLLINNRSYSDAEIFPSAFRTLGLGKIVGQATGGLVIGTSSIRLIDGSSFRVPRLGVFTTKGINMEKEGVPPDIAVETNPDQMAKGIDAQLDKAVEVLQQDVVVWKKTHTRTASKPEEGKPAVPVSTTPMGK